MIQPATAARTGGFCGPCDSKRKKIAHDEYVRTNRKDVDRFAGVSDPVELLRLIYTKPLPNPIVNLLPPPRSIEDIYLQLSKADGERLLSLAILAVKAGDFNLAKKIAQHVATFTNLSLDSLLESCLSTNLPLPPVCFRGAGSKVRDGLAAAFRPTTTLLEADQLLSSLAWIGDSTVLEFLMQAQLERPIWSESLYIGPADYSRVAGWEIASATRRELTFSTCLGIKIVQKSEDPGLLRVMRDCTSTCPWCQGLLANLIEADLRQPPLNAFDELGDSIQVLTCPRCVCYGPIHADLDVESRGTWSERNVRPTHLPPDISEYKRSPWSGAAVQLIARNPLHGSECFGPTTISQVGGHPAWVQDLAYPNCLRCDQTMRFFAQVDEGAFQGREGVYYAFVCASCRTTATCFQQT